jgi:hypothetical protein
VDFENIFFGDGIIRFPGFDVIKDFHIIFEFFFVSWSGLDFFSCKKSFSFSIGYSISFYLGAIDSATQSCYLLQFLLSFWYDMGIFDHSPNTIDLFYLGDDGVGDGEVDVRHFLK